MPITCSYCLNDLRPTDLVRACNRCGAQLPRTLSAALQARFNHLACPSGKCQGTCSILHCGVCGKELPAGFDRFDHYLRVAVVAPSGAGKTNFITAMTEELRRNPVLRYSVTPMNRETQRYQDANAELLYDKLAPIANTHKGQCIPMQWCVQDMNRMSARRIPSYAMTVFDGAGEDQASLDPVICRYISGSKAIILLLDPTQLAGVRACMTEKELRSAGADPSVTISPRDTEQFITNLINYLKTSCHINLDHKLTVPVAVAFAKLDALADHLRGTTVIQPSGYAADGLYDPREAELVHQEISAWLLQCGDPLDKLFNKHLRTWHYFGLSSFGVKPDGEAPGAPRPLRVIDPLLWDLCLEGIVNEKK